jgi:hypothetical protein
MAVARDTETRFPVTTNTFSTATGDQTFSHSGAALAGAATVMVFCTGTTAVVTGVLYGGVAMTLQATGTDTVETGRVDTYVLSGAGFPTGTQTVTLQGCTATQKWASCMTVTVAAGQEGAVDASGAVNTTTSTNPTVSVTLANTALGYMGVHSGLNAPPTAGIDNSGVHTGDYGTVTSATFRKNTTDLAGSRSFAVTGASDDWCAAAVWFAEAAPAAAELPLLVMAPPIAA